MLAVLVSVGDTVTEGVDSYGLHMYGYQKKSRPAVVNKLPLSISSNAAPQWISTDLSPRWIPGQYAENV
jgi:hypothetical protein